ncbi:hypothetical protein H072_1881 [Dactylellina haptotyla CBS 200.50]|uniref:DUF7580 domain-containing protein n=1 Tax=Dactylellina haptotyla (strain CBS 200.50) TaxID=1284197 RepID=S8AMN8_DACHA|nr:hypothetical protein H072_1881 [Dactylellina haptotyla CBS 200.50]
MPYRPPVPTESAGLSRRTYIETTGEVPFPSILPLSRQPTAVNVCYDGPNVACQLAGKGAHLHGGATHTLDDELPEWQLFEAVQPLFASNLQWELRRHSAGRVGVDAEAIGSENLLDFFKYEMKRLPDNAPGKKLSCEVYGNCIETLTDLLDLLERLVQEHILHDLELGESEEVKGNIKISNLPDPKLKEQLVVSASMFTSIYSWLGVEFAAPLQSPPEPLFDSSSSNHKGQEDPAPEENKDHPKLRALGKAVSIALEDGTDLGQTCSAYLQLDHTTEEFADAVDVLSSFNTCLESPDVSGGAKPHDLTYALEISRTRWEDVGPSNFSSLLFNILQKKISGCQANQSEKHQAMLRLNGFQLEDNPLAFDMFFHPCKRSNYWQESRFTPKGKNLQNFARPEFVHNLCGYIDRFPEESNPVVLSIAFDKTKLLATTADLLAHAGALPEKSLEDLLGRGFFRKPTAGGAFSPGDKAVLTLSLARCLLHFFQGPWMERPWSAESVRFLQRNTSTEILDIHHPYIRYVLPNEVGTTVEPKFAKFQRVMLSFGRLLLEIETGENIVIDSSLESDPDDVKNTLMDILDRQEEPRGPYHLAVEGCLKFKASLASIQKREPKLELDHQIRKVIYTSVIKHLEQNLSCFEITKSFWPGGTSKSPTDQSQPRQK